MSSLSEIFPKVLKLLKENYPDAKIKLKFANPFQLLVSTILSAQCTDEQVNKVAVDLYKKYKSPKDFAEVDLVKLEQDIRSTGFYRNKAKNIKRASQIIMDKFNGTVPKSMEELIILPGVARKTANIVLSDGYGIIKGIAVDTHVLRLSQRLGLTDQREPNKIERDLMNIVPEADWHIFAHLLQAHGRAACTAKKPDCQNCFLNRLCPSAFKFK